MNGQEQSLTRATDSNYYHCEKLFMAASFCSFNSKSSKMFVTVRDELKTTNMLDNGLCSILTFNW